MVQMSGRSTMGISEMSDGPKYFFTMSVSELAAAQFKEGILGVLHDSASYVEGAQFNFIELDIRRPADRIEYPGYDRAVKVNFGSSLPYVGSPVRVVAVVPVEFRLSLSGVPVEETARFEESGGTYPGDVILMYANKALGEGFGSLDLEAKREVVRSLLARDVRQLDMWGVYPVTFEVVPEIDGCLPEFVHPSSGAYLSRCLDKVRRCAIRRSGGRSAM